MVSQKNRYFIELQSATTEPVPRYLETELRRKRALEFMKVLSEWIKDQDMQSRVQAMAVTALGQVQITCDADVLHQIRNQDIMEIAAVRQGSLMSENVSRWSDFGLQNTMS